MRDRPLIITGLIVFVGLFTYPLWHASAARSSAAAPEIKLPTQETECVAPVSYMRDSHMQLLVNWREEVVRNNQRQFKAFNGKVHDKSLTGTCLSQCHKDKSGFCDRCHKYAGVSGPYCWDCHNEPNVMARSAP